MTYRRPDLSYERDGSSLYDISNYLYNEHRAVWSANPFAVWLHPRRARRERRLSAAVDVLHELSRELRIRGELNNRTMFTRDEEDGAA